MAKNGDIKELLSFKVVAMVVSLLVALSIILGGAMWLSNTQANFAVAIAKNTDAIANLQKTDETLHAKSVRQSMILRQHDQVLSVLNQHGAEIKALTDFMVKGDRYTLERGEAHEQRTSKIESWISEAPPDWFEANVRIVSEALNKVAAAVRENHEAIMLLQYEIKHVKGAK